jgi:hypothetical protein
VPRNFELVIHASYNENFNITYHEHDAFRNSNLLKGWVSVLAVLEGTKSYSIGAVKQVAVRGIGGSENTFHTPGPPATSIIA